MSFIELMMIAVGLSMDAFAVSICKGLSIKKLCLHHLLIIGCYFGVFQAIMHLLGYLLGIRFQEIISSIDHWIAFIILGIIGINMIRSSQEEEKTYSNSLYIGTMITLAFATSVDALAVGITSAFLNIQIIPAVVFIGIVTFFLSACGVKVGNVFGSRFQSKAVVAGGIILILIGTKILIEHLITEGGIHFG